MFSKNDYFSLSGNGGIVGLSEDEDKFRRLQICSPEVARVVSEFEDITVLKGNEHSEFHYHEDSKAFQEKFAKHAALLTTEVNQLGNPFGPDESKKLVQLGTKDVMADNVVSTVRNIEEIGRKQHAEFREKLEYSAKSLNWMTRLRRINFKHSRRQIRRVGQLKQSHRSSKYMCGYFHRCIYQHRFVEEIWRSSSAMRLCSIHQPWQGVAEYALETNLTFLSASNPCLIQRQSVTNRKCQLLFWKVRYW